MTNDYHIPSPILTAQDSPAHDLARSRRMITVEDVDLIQWATRELAHVRGLNVYDLGAGSGTTAASVLSVRGEHIHGTTLDISQENLDWSQQFVTQTWREGGIVAPDPFPVPCIFATWMGNRQWRWINSPSIPPWNPRDRSIHLLLIDTSHTYEETLDELIWWRPKMHVDHFVWLDDYTTYPGVKQAVDELVEHDMLRVVHQQGQGILCRYRGR